MLTAIKSAKTNGLTAVPVTVECEITPGIGIHLVGLADTAVKESLLRVVTALQGKGFHIPGKKIIINLAPAELVKSGTGYDLPIAAALVAESGQMALPKADKFILVGELGLDGSLRDVPGTYPIAQLAAENPDIEGIILPMDNAIEAADIEGVDIYAVNDIAGALAILEGKMEVEEMLVKNTSRYNLRLREETKFFKKTGTDFADIPGNNAAKRAVEIAAAGGHNLILMGAPGSGKTSLAKALTGILPPMTKKESEEVSRICSVSGRGPMLVGAAKHRPFRAPHWSVSITTLFGGGSGDVVRPGEVSLAHNGVLYLDEIAEMPKSVKEMFRVPLEDHEIKISRLKGVTTFPARFQLVASTNPCPCGYYGEGDRCTCTPNQRRAYLEKALPYQLMEHIDIQAWPRPWKPLPGMETPPPSEPSSVVAERVAKAVEIQKKRFEGTPIRRNAEMEGDDLNRYCPLDEECRELIDKLITRLGLSARSFKRIVRIARTIADLEGSENIKTHHLAEASSFRFLDRNDFIA